MAPDANKPRSSYPGLWKSPSYLSNPFYSTDDWISGKVKDDDIGKNLWRIHDKLYDLTGFIDSHPGGSEWLRKTRGTDITEAFETSHTAHPSMVEKMVEKFYVKEATTQRNSPYTFHENGFYKTLKRNAAPVIQKVGTGPTFSMKFMQDLMAVLFLATAIVASIYDSILMAILAGAFLTFVSIGGHNFQHLRDNWRKYYVDVALISSYEFNTSHALSHHLFPNSILDIELFLVPEWNFLPTAEKTWSQKYLPPLTSHWLYLISFWRVLKGRLVNILAERLPFRPEYSIVFIELVILWIFSSFFVAFKVWFIMHTTSSYLFFTIGLNASHHHPDVFHDGDIPRKDHDFGLLQLDATGQRHTLGENPFLITFSFGEHVLHHFFPTVCHSKLHHLRPILDETVAQWNSKAVELSQMELFIGGFQQLARTEVKPPKNE